MIIDWNSCLLALAGGIMIGTSATMLLYFNRRIAGVSGIFATLIGWAPAERAWRFAYIAGMVLGGLALYVAWPSRFGSPPSTDVGVLVLAGILVGVGTRLGRGCTSGHGVCGLSRLSPRSFVANVAFISSGVLTVTAIRMLGVFQ